MCLNSVESSLNSLASKLKIWGPELQDCLSLSAEPNNPKLQFYAQQFGQYHQLLGQGSETTSSVCKHYNFLHRFF